MSSLCPCCGQQRPRYREELATFYERLRDVRSVAPFPIALRVAFAGLPQEFTVAGLRAADHQEIPVEIADEILQIAAGSRHAGSGGDTDGQAERMFQLLCDAASALEREGVSG